MRGKYKNTQQKRKTNGNRKYREESFTWSLQVCLSQGEGYPFIECRNYQFKFFNQIH